MKKLLFTAIIALGFIGFSYAQVGYDQEIRLSVFEDNAVVMDSEWKFELDFKEMAITVTGGDIINNHAEDHAGLVLDAYLVDGVQDKLDADFAGVRLFSADVEKVPTGSILKDVRVTSNLTFIPMSGTHSIMLTLATKDNDGNVVVRSKRVFPNAETF